MSTANKKGEPKFSLMIHGALDRIRTCGTLLRRQVLYPLSYEGGSWCPLRGAGYYRPNMAAVPQNFKIPHGWHGMGASDTVGRAAAQAAAAPRRRGRVNDRR